jgi:hypothetical protein
MRNGFIIIAVSNKGIEKVKLYHDGKEESLNNTLNLYKRINPCLNRLNTTARGRNQCDQLCLKAI